MNVRAVVSIGLTAAHGSGRLHDPALACTRVLSHARSQSVVARTSQLCMPDHPRLAI